MDSSGSQSFERPWHAAYAARLSSLSEYPNQPLWSVIKEGAKRFGTSCAIRDEASELSYQQLCERVAAAAGGIKERLPETSEAEDAPRVLLWMGNSAEFVVLYYAALAAGCIVSAASPKLSEAELMAQAESVDPALVLCDAELLVHVPSKLAERALVMGADSLEGELSASGRFPEITQGDYSQVPAVLQYTSGTTGVAKGAMMSHRNLMANALQNARWFGWSEKEVNLAILPLCHTWGMSCLMNSTLAVGGTLVLPGGPDHFDPAKVYDWVEEYQATILYGSATMFYAMLDCPEADPAKLRSLRHTKAGAMLVAGNLKQRWDAFCPNAPLQLGYGLTEASPETHNNPPHRHKAGTVGVPIQSTDCRIVDPEYPSRVLGSGEEGEVLIKGPQVFMGYWRNQEATDKSLVDGWLRTGDIGRMDEEGYLTIVDRKKDLIKFRGYSIAPATIERVLLQHPNVKEAAVVGRLDEVQGEIPVAFVVTRSGELDAEALKTLCKEKLARYEVPREFRQIDAIPKNRIGKPLRRALRDSLRG